MKNIHNILAVAAIALTFTACSSDNDTPADNGKEYPISLSVGISDLSVVTRAENTTTLTDGELGLYITKNGEKDVLGKYLCNNEKFTCDNNVWSCTNTYYWAADNATIDYIAYHPYRSSITGNYIYWDGTEQSNGNFDLLYVNSSATNSADNHSIKITLGHACSKLVVNVSKLGSEITGGTISSIKIGGLKAKGNFYLFTDTYNQIDAGSWDPDVNTAEIGMAALATPNQDMKATYEAILIPQTASFTLTISLSNNSEYQLAVPTQTFAAGYCYSLTIQVGQDKVNLGSITQTDWVPGNSGDDNHLTAQ